MALAKQEGLTDRYISRQLTFAFMAPQLVEAMVSDEQRFSILWVKDLRESQLPLSWQRQGDIGVTKHELSADAAFLRFLDLMDEQLKLERAGANSCHRAPASPHG
jgi:hypothetical protein